MNIAVITGASSGMGEEFARQLSSDRYAQIGGPFDEIWLLARSKDKLDSLVNALGKDRFRAVPCDLTDSASVDSFASLLASEKPTVGLLINSAGMGKNGAFLSQSVEDTNQSVSLNCRALSEVTRIVLPYMTPKGENAAKKDRPRIINIASSAGFLPQPGFAIYAATKAFVISFSRALNVELKNKNITVTCICPGPCETNFIKVSKNDPNATFTGFKSKFVTTVDKLIPASLRAAGKGKSMLVFGFGQKLLHLASKIVPTNWILFFERKMV